MKLSPPVRIRLFLAAICAALALPGCAVVGHRTDPQVVRAKQQLAAFRSQTGWRNKIYRDDTLLGKAKGTNAAVEIALREQRGLLLVDGAVAMDFPVATGRPGHSTPKGSYKILEKKKDYRSNIYGQIVSGDGNTVVSDADTREDAVPQGSQFVGAPMPYWMRMTPTGVGMHVGHVPGHRPASHGCIRLKRETAVELFGILDVGTPVKVDSFASALGGPLGVGSVVVGEMTEEPERPRRARQPSPSPATALGGGAASAATPEQNFAPSQEAAPSPTPATESPAVPEGSPTPVPPVTPAAEPAATTSAGI